MRFVFATAGDGGGSSALTHFFALPRHLLTACKDDDGDNLFAAWDSINDVCYCQLGGPSCPYRDAGVLPGGTLYAFENQGSAGVSKRSWILLMMRLAMMSTLGLLPFAKTHTHARVYVINDLIIIGLPRSLAPPAPRS